MLVQAKEILNMAFLFFSVSVTDTAVRKHLGLCDPRTAKHEAFLWNGGAVRRQYSVPTPLQDTNEGQAHWKDVSRKQAQRQGLQSPLQVNEGLQEPFSRQSDLGDPHHPRVQVSPGTHMAC